MPGERRKPVAPVAKKLSNYTRAFLFFGSSPSEGSMLSRSRDLFRANYYGETAAANCHPLRGKGGERGRNILPAVIVTTVGNDCLRPRRAKIGYRKVAVFSYLGISTKCDDDPKAIS